MDFLNSPLRLLLLFFGIHLTAARRGAHEITEIIIPQPTAAISAPLYITEIWSTTEVFVTCFSFAPGPTLLSSITTSTVTTIQPAVTSYPATVLETVISKVTLEYQFYYSDPASDTISIKSGIYSQQPTATVVLGPPNVTPVANALVTGSVCGCPSQPAHGIIPCGAMCCTSTWN